MCFTHTFANVWAKTFTQQQVTFQNFIDFFSPSPDLVILSRTELADAINIFYVAFIVWRAFTVQTEYRRKYTPRKPANQQLAKCRIFVIATQETADIRRPPRNAGKSHVKPGLHLLFHRTERGMNIARPRQSTIFLAADPGAAHKV